MSARNGLFGGRWLARSVATAVVALTLTAVLYGASDAESIAPASIAPASIAPASIAPETFDITRATDAAKLQPAVRVSPPVAAAAPIDVVETPATQIINRSTCRTGEPANSMTITIVDISYLCPVFPGGQSTIDSGAVTMITDQSSPLLTTVPGGPGTLWVVAHRTTHGGAFAAVPSLADGALITVTDSGATATYQIVGRAYVRVRGGLVIDGSGIPTQAATKESIARSDYGGNLAPRLLLQTCDGENNRWMIYADLVAN